MVMENPYIQCNEDAFYTNYQINRNIAYVKEGDSVIFLTPKANNAQGMEKGRKYIDNLKNCNICNLYWEEIVEALLEMVKNLPELHDYYMKFYNKYIHILTV